MPDNSKKTDHGLMIFVLLIGFLIGAYLVLTSKVSLSRLTEPFQFKNETLNNSDEDNDGLTNQQEETLKTDKFKKDTDNDGYLDGEELLSGHDPLKPEPDDLLTSDNHLFRVFQNMTESLGTKIYAGFFDNTIPFLNDYSKNASLLNPISAETKTDINRFFVLPPISINEFKINSDNSAGSFKDYQETISKIFLKNFSREEINQPIWEIIGDAAETDDYSELKKYQTAFQNSLIETKTISVPSSLIEKHKEFLNLIWMMQKSFEALVQKGEDPLRAIIALKNIESFFETAF